jgi:flagellar motor switch protein FliM
MGRQDGICQMILLQCVLVCTILYKPMLTEHSTAQHNRTQQDAASTDSLEEEVGNASITVRAEVEVSASRVPTIWQPGTKFHQQI